MSNDRLLLIEEDKYLKILHILKNVNIMSTKKLSNAARVYKKCKEILETLEKCGLVTKIVQRDEKGMIKIMLWMLTEKGRRLIEAVEKILLEEESEQKENKTATLHEM